nr:uncharacterized protein LOC113828774 [Penaeus vannamei]
MRFLVLACALVASATAAPQGYSLQRPTGSTLSTGPGQTAGSGLSVGSGAGHGVAGGIVIGSGHGVGSGVSTGAGLGGLSVGSGQGVGTGISGGTGILEPCGEGQIRHVDGSCVTPVVNRKVYVFDVPEQKGPIGPPPSVPPPRVDHNILFVRLPEEGEGPEPIVIPHQDRRTSSMYSTRRTNRLSVSSKYQPILHLIPKSTSLIMKRVRTQLYPLVWISTLLLFSR